ncbi:DUF983 domain-containing protein [Alsobacter sp. SYSU M60028]|uniref:DUF983 domain-containing protein n=1 Tax=Alsobacter ponti TaxID=2962936 RepID=A0ABT1LDR4_9HYPH|nr:DUF983 domain-containing protein [Alsobacter ponti]
MTEPGPAYDGPRPSPYAAGLAGRCPRCGKGKLFRGFLAVAPGCDACGLDYGFADSGDGPAVFIMLAVGVVMVGGVLLVDVMYEPPMWVHAVIWPPLTIVLSLGLLRPLKGLLIALQYHHKAEQGRLE